MKTKGMLALSLFGFWFALEPVLADPPPWAPAHGWRRKHDPFYVGYAGRQWSDDYGVISGRCNTDMVLTAIGAAAGGTIGNRTASDENRAVATIVGAIVGGVIGNAIGERIDAKDRACTGHALELARVGQKVRWDNPETGVSYTVRPTRDLADHCREFEFRAQGRSASAPVKLKGCARPGGEWVLTG
jgi:surface antigen